MINLNPPVFMKKLFGAMLFCLLLSGCKDKDQEVKPGYKVKYLVKGSGYMNIDTLRYLDERGQHIILTNVNSFSKEFQTGSKVSAMLQAKGWITSGSCTFEYNVTGAKQDSYTKTYNFSGTGIFNFDIKKETEFK